MAELITPVSTNHVVFPSQPPMSGEQWSVLFSDGTEYTHLVVRHEDDNPMEVGVTHLLAGGTESVLLPHRYPYHQLVTRSLAEIALAHRRQTGVLPSWAAGIPRQS